MKYIIMCTFLYIAIIITTIYKLNNTIVSKETPEISEQLVIIYQK